MGICKTCSKNIIILFSKGPQTHLIQFQNMKQYYEKGNRKTNAHHKAFTGIIFLEKYH